MLVFSKLTASSTCTPNRSKSFCLSSIYSALRCTSQTGSRVTRDIAVGHFVLTVKHCVDLVQYVKQALNAHLDDGVVLGDLVP